MFFAFDVLVMEDIITFASVYTFFLMINTFTYDFFCWWFKRSTLLLMIFFGGGGYHTVPNSIPKVALKKVGTLKVPKIYWLGQVSFLDTSDYKFVRIFLWENQDHFFRFKKLVTTFSDGKSWCGVSQIEKIGTNFLR